MKYRRNTLKISIMAKWIVNAIPYKSLLIVISIFSRGMTLVNPVLFGILISSFSNDEIRRSSFVFLGLILACELVTVFSSWAQDNLVNKAFLRQERNLKQLVWENIQNIPKIKRDALSPSNWMQKIERDVPMISGVCRMFFEVGIAFIISFIGTTVVVLYRAPVLSLIFLGALLVMLIIPKLLHKRIGLSAKQIRESYYSETETVMNVIEMQSITTLFKVRLLFAQLFEKSIKNTENKQYSHQLNLNRFNFFIQMVLWGVNGLVLIVCVALLLKKQITIGEVVTFNMLVSQVLGGLAQLIHIFPQVSIGLEYAGSIYETISQGQIGQKKEMKNESVTDANVVSKNLVFDINAVSFKYPEATDAIISDFSAKFFKGEYICLLGRNGSGKSTLIKLLVGDYEPDKGVIYRNYDVIALVPQNIVVYTDSLFENIRLKDESIREGDVELMVRKFGFGRLIDNPSLGLHKMIMSGQLSGGELQILGIARALIRKPDVLIIDEITNNLDIVAKESVFSVLRQIRKECTIISITHDHSSIDEADRVFVFRKNRITEVKGDDGLMRSKHAIDLIRKELV